MNRELQQQLSVIQAHSKTMEELKDDKQLLTEMKKHQKMTDAFLGSLVGQREKLQAQMQTQQKQLQEQRKQRISQMHNKLEELKKTEGSEPEADPEPDPE